jgi:site-specific recombinase XerD
MTLKQYPVVSAGNAVTEASGYEVIPEAIAREGEHAAWQFLEFFTAKIANDNTRKAYHRAVLRFFRWVEDRGLLLREIRPPHVAAYVKELGVRYAAPSVKQELAGIRMLFDSLVVGQVIPMNPATSVRGPSHSAKRGKTPVLSEDEARLLISSIDASSVVGLRDRALISVLLYAFARVGAVVRMNLEDYYPQGKRWWFCLHEKGGKRHEMPAHHKAEEYMDAYIEGADLGGNKKEALFRTAIGRTKVFSSSRMSTKDAWYMVQRRAEDAGIETRIGCHSFRATGITNYLENGGTLEKAQQMAAHESARTTKLYDRRNDTVTLDEVERIAI